jgi:hypothetical protein
MSDLIKIDVFIDVLNIIQKLDNLYSKKKWLEEIPAI